ncbi:uncharacterized protein J8A68_000302 [[Candida] subhashii]|uniref:Alpha-1,3-mannosyltransferase n=1 Tax=[Candida] subhashii TaxID=561895 RepID=A0A8J5QK23_9ASCO|nr:uncharacterized protein J8A68_000302 [[Candida] subhashii]KAG7666156.1 hypothetical protein J8A68_000302 [[Candida] subhashii]
MIEKIRINRTRQKLLVYVCLVIWLIGINLWLFKSHPISGFRKASSVAHSIYDQYSDEVVYGQQSYNENTDEDNKNEQQKHVKTMYKDAFFQLLTKQSKIKDHRNIQDAHSQTYDSIFKNHEISSVVGNLDFNERCQLYFQNVFIDDHNWLFNPNEKIKLENKDQFKLEDFKKDKEGDLKSDFASKKGIKTDDVKVDSDEFRAFAKEKYDEFWNETMVYEQKIVDTLSTFRIFNKCFITNDNQTQVTANEHFIQKQHQFVKALKSSGVASTGLTPFEATHKETLIDLTRSNFEHRVYPWLSFEPPVYEDWRGHIYHSPPDLNAIKKMKPQKAFPRKNFQFFLKSFKEACNGKGIVLSIGDQHVDDTIKLIHLLRALNNKLPIQIVYYDNLTTDTKKKIVTAAREKIFALPKSFQKVADQFPDDYLSPEDSGLPKQEVWFVNTYNVIHNDFKDKFQKFANKFLATLFNSFEEFMLIDADTILFQNPEFFFNLKGYKETGTYFYRDRTADTRHRDSDAYFFKKITPSVIDQVMFNIPIITSHTLNREFFKDGEFHYMESGLVVLNRDRHFSSILLMLQMYFFHPVAERIHGDKEVFWLAMAANGDESYHFNDYFAAAIGQVTPQEFRQRKDGHNRYSLEICSPHPGHIDSEDGKSLVWMNSGFQYCGQADIIDYKKEADKKTRLKWLENEDSFKTFYYSPLRITHAIIPPLDVVAAENVEDEPSTGWHMDEEYCNSYMWCAYSSIGGKTKDGGNNKVDGKVFEFDQKDQDLFTYYGDIWVGLE